MTSVFPNTFHLDILEENELWLSSRSRGCDTAITVLSPRGKRLGYWKDGGVGHNPLAAFVVRDPGLHTVVVHSREGAGSCRVLALGAGL